VTVESLDYTLRRVQIRDTDSMLVMR